MMNDPQDPRMPSRQSRRMFLRTLVGGAAAAAGGTLLAACGGANPAAPADSPTAPAAAAPTVAPAPPATSAPAVNSGSVTITVMGKGSDFTEEELKAFMAANPGITVEKIDDDATRFQAMVAAGTPPDLFRTQAPIVPNLLARELLLDLTGYFAASSTLKLDDLAPAASFYRFDERVYGMPKDWSPDLSLFASKVAFDEAGLTVPDPMKALRYTELAELGQKLTSRDGDRTLRVGYSYDNGFLPRMIQTLLVEQGQELYSPDNSAVVLRENPAVLEVLRFFYELAASNSTFTPLNPSPAWLGEDFVNGQVALAHYGYWFSGMVSSAEQPAVGPDQTVMLTSPSWTGSKQVNPTITATGFVIAKGSKDPDAAWKLFEYYNAGEPALARASSGWGVPALKSLYGMMPKESPFQQQVQGVLAGELKNADYGLQINPYYDDRVFGNSWKTNLEQALRGDITFEQLVENVESEVNTAIADGIASI